MMFTLVPTAMAEGSDPVAQIGETTYATLKAAFEGAKDGDTITLTDDIKVEDTLVVTKTLTLDLAEHTLSNEKNIWSDDNWSLISVRGNGNLTITGNGKLEAKKDDCYPVDVQDEGAQLTIEDGTFIGNIHAVYVKTGAAYIKGGTYSVQQKYPDSSKADEFVLNLYDANRRNGTAKLSVSGGIFVAFNPANCQAEAQGTNFCAAGYTTSTKGNNTYTVVEGENAAVANAGANYNTLANAISSADSGDTVTLLKDTKEDITIPAGKIITLDLNGNKLTNVSGHTITNNGNLTVTGNGTVDNITDGKGALVNKVGAIATLNGGTFTRSQEAGTYEPDLANGNSWYTVKNYGTMTINADTTVTTRLTDDNGNAVGGRSSLIANGWQNANDLTNNPRNGNQNALLTVNGGTFIGGINTVKNDDYSELVFNNGTCTNYTQAAFQNHNIATINGGSFVAESHWSIYNCPCNANSDKGELTITGGSFTGNIAHVKADYGFIKISGGTYSVNPTAYVADTHIVRKDGDAQFTVVAKSNLTSGVYLTDPSGALASNYYVSSTANGVWTVSYSAPYSGGSSSYDPTYSVSTPSKSKGDTVTVTVKPDSGYVLETLTVTDKNGNELTLKDKGDGKYTFTMPAGKVEVKATFMEDNSVLNFFYDVPNGAYFYEAVKWAVDKGITNGLSDTMFGPYESCTRAQIVTFLWRAAGSPEPKTASSFTDVPANAYYAKAVAWAVENGITNGMTATMFAPDATCTRGQSVTFLYRALKGTASGSANFTDVKSDAFYADAINWAVANNVTNGTSNTTFSPNADCTRAEIVTFLYRAYQGK